MKRPRLACVLSAAAATAVVASGCASKETGSPATEEKPAAINQATPAEDQPAVTANEVSFTESIKPLLAEKCTICHNTQVLPKRPNLETREGVMKSGVIVPGKPDESLILSLIVQDPEAEKAMPPVSHRLTKEQISLLRKWIEQGADWPSGEAGRIVPAFIPEE